MRLNKEKCNIFSKWDDVESKIYTAEEIAAADLKVAKLSQRLGNISSVVYAFEYMQGQMKEYEGKYSDEEIMQWVKDMRKGEKSEILLSSGVD